MSVRKLWALLLMAFPTCLLAQTVNATLGGSQMLGMAGAQANYAYKDTFGWTGLGYYDGRVQVSGYLNMPLELGPLLRSKRVKYRVGAGDQELNTAVITDEFEMHRSTVRGVSIYRHSDKSDIQAFVGSNSIDDQQPYFHAISQVNSKLSAAIIGHFTPAKNWQIQSFNTFGKSATAIQSVAWTPSRRWRLSSAAGFGSNRPYVANAAEYKKGELNLRASYTFASNQFRRQESNYGIEPLGFNAKAELPLGRNTMARFYHRSELVVIPAYLGYKQNSSVGTTNAAGISTKIFGFRTSAFVNESSSRSYAGKNFSGVLSVSRRILPRWHTTYSYLHSSMRAQDIVVHQNNNEFRVNSHLSLSHTFALMNGTMSSTFGGRWSSNRLTFSIDNQVYTSSIAAQFGQKSVFQAWTFSIRFRIPHGATVNLDTAVDPMGKTQWGGYLSGLHYQRLSSYSPEDTYVSFSKYVIRGKVVDEAGAGVWGIAVQVGPELVYSDTKGEFFIRVKNAKPLPLSIQSDASLQPAAWTLESAPKLVRGAHETSTEPAVVVVVRSSRGTMVASKR